MISGYIKGLFLSLYPFRRGRKSLIRFLSFRFPGPILYSGTYGARYLLDGRNYIDQRILRDGVFEREGLDSLCQAITERRCDLFLDIGANIGVYALAVALRTGCRDITCFEPDPMNRNQFAANIFLNGLDDRITVRTEAVSDREGSATFYLQRDKEHLSSGQSSLESFEDGIMPFAQGATHSVDVQVARLDTLLSVTGRSIAIKLDVEGHEANAIRGMAELIKRNRIYLQIEIWDANFDAMRKLLEELGLSCERRFMEHDYIFTKDTW